MGFELDPVAFYAQSSGLGENKDPLNPYQNFSAENAKSYGKKFGQGIGAGAGIGYGLVGNDFSPSSTGLQSLVGASVADQEMELALATNALNNMTNYKIGKAQREMQAEQGAKNRSAGRSNAIIGAVGSVGAAAVGALI